jgi:hypothetical protein
VVRAEDRKTKAQRNKERRLAEERRRAEEERLAKQRENEVYRCVSDKRAAGIALHGRVGGIGSDKAWMTREVVGFFFGAGGH